MSRARKEKVAAGVRTRRVRNVAYGAFQANGGSLLAAIEAVAPYLMEQAWDECEAAKYDIQLNPAGDAWEAVKANPYRATK